LKQTTTNRTALDKDNLKKQLAENYPLLAVLVGFMLVSLSIGPYVNGDTAWEYDAATGVLRTGLPLISNGNMMDQPPLGFYIQAVFFKIFGASIQNGTLLVTLLGLGSAVLVYKIGQAAYGKVAGVFAAVLFAFSPWNLILSRSFLIDVPCLFFSLLSLWVGIAAVRRGSIRFFLVAGLLFAAAFSTKLYAAFVLVPLLIYFFYHRPKKPKLLSVWLAGFLAPTVLISYLWYQIVLGQGLSSLLFHTDFTVSGSLLFVPSYFFVGNFLINYGLGWFFLDAALLSLLLHSVRKDLFRSVFVFDAICLVTVLCIVGINTFLGAGLRLKVPYFNAIKYDFQALPFFSLLAASLIGKSSALFRFAQSETGRRRIPLMVVAAVGAFFVVGAVIVNMNYVHMFSTWDYLLFRVEPEVNLGYSLFNPTPIGRFSLPMAIQYMGYAIAASGLLTAGLKKIGWTR
jgi:4-amino-4-deoxy-L-arabinose transferase-like glycosyltransferase